LLTTFSLSKVILIQYTVFKKFALTQGAVSMVRIWTGSEALGCTSGIRFRFWYFMYILPYTVLTFFLYNEWQRHRCATNFLNILVNDPLFLCGNLTPLHIAQRCHIREALTTFKGNIYRWNVLSLDRNIFGNSGVIDTAVSSRILSHIQKVFKSCIRGLVGVFHLKKTGPLINWLLLIWGSLFRGFVFSAQLYSENDKRISRKLLRRKRKLSSYH
jgi:hypothetical protein